VTGVSVCVECHISNFNLTKCVLVSKLNDGETRNLKIRSAVQHNEKPGKESYCNLAVFKIVLHSV